MKPKWWHVIEQLELSTLPLGIYYGIITLENNAATSFKVIHTHSYGASQVVVEVKNLSASARNVRDTDSISGLGRSPGGGRGNPLQYSCLENPTDRGTQQAMVHRVSKSQTQLKQLSRHAQKHMFRNLCSQPLC